MRKLLWWVFAGTAGGPNRARIVMALNERPYNAHQLAEKLGLNYKTVRHHLKILMKTTLLLPLEKINMASYISSQVKWKKIMIFSRIYGMNWCNSKHNFNC